MSYDSDCYELAEKFLDEEPNAFPIDKEKLAQQIQDVIEDYIRFEVTPRKAGTA